LLAKLRLLKQMQVVDDPSKADFILAHGTEALALPGGGSRDMSLDGMQVLLQQCAQRQSRQLPMVVANPDLVSQYVNINNVAIKFLFQCLP
jgi:hypothetical protein